MRCTLLIQLTKNQALCSYNCNLHWRLLHFERYVPAEVRAPCFVCVGVEDQCDAK